MKKWDQVAADLMGRMDQELPELPPSDTEEGYVPLGEGDGSELATSVAEKELADTILGTFGDDERNVDGNETMMDKLNDERDFIEDNEDAMSREEIVLDEDRVRPMYEQ